MFQKVRKMSSQFYQDWADDVNKIRRYHGWSTVTVSDLMDLQRRNVEALTREQQEKERKKYQPPPQRIVIRDNKTGKTIQDYTIIRY